MISGLSHITFIVKDIERTSEFFEIIFGAEEIYSSGDKTFSLSRERYFLISGIWLCIMEGETLPERTYNHIAFQINEDEIEDYIERIKKAGAEIRPGRERVQGEGRSVYFYDYDNHLFELHAGSLDERLSRYSAE